MPHVKTQFLMEVLFIDNLPVIFPQLRRNGRAEREKVQVRPVYPVAPLVLRGDFKQPLPASRQFFLGLVEAFL
jgi:hypothetical protein